MHLDLWCLFLNLPVDVNLILSDAPLEPTLNLNDVALLDELKSPSVDIA